MELKELLSMNNYTSEKGIGMSSPSEMKKFFEQSMKP
jgi:hypothetical protein